MKAPSDRRQAEPSAAALRALTGDRELHFRGPHPYRGERPVPLRAPHLRIETETAGRADRRACADGLALRLLHSSAELHRRLCPADPVERLIFELLEQLRVETLAPAALPGMAANLHQRFEAWSRAFLASGLAESHAGILLFTVAQICWSRLFSLPVPEPAADLIETTRAGIVAVLGGPLAGMRRWRGDQERFARHALEVARFVGTGLKAEGTSGNDDCAEADAARQGFALLLDLDPAETDDSAAASAGTGKSRSGNDSAYRAFTSCFDAEIEPAAAVRKVLLREYRERLDARVAGWDINLPRLAGSCAALFAVARRERWSFNEEEGKVDGRRLAQLASSPAERRVFRRTETLPAAAGVVGILIDCSGSMRGGIENVAALADVLVRALDLAGVESEVLGFTTGAWNGGRAYKAWRRQGQPLRPGRLNEVCHMIFKRAESSWRRARTDIAALLKADLFREGIDGEAIDWACERLCGRDAARRVLLVVSDGCPMDAATTLANGAGYLDMHLHATLARRARQGAVEIVGIGVGDLGETGGLHYRRAASADFSAMSPREICAGILRAIGPR